MQYQHLSSVQKWMAAAYEQLLGAVILIAGEEGQGKKVSVAKPLSVVLVFFCNSIGETGRFLACINHTTHSSKK